MQYRMEICELLKGPPCDLPKPGMREPFLPLTIHWCQYSRLSFLILFRSALPGPVSKDRDRCRRQHHRVSARLTFGGQGMTRSTFPFKIKGIFHGRLLVGKMFFLAHLSTHRVFIIHLHNKRNLSGRKSQRNLRGKVPFCLECSGPRPECIVPGGMVCNSVFNPHNRNESRKDSISIEAVVGLEKAKVIAACSLLRAAPVFRARDPIEAPPQRLTKVRDRHKSSTARAGWSGRSWIDQIKHESLQR